MANSVTDILSRLFNITVLDPNVPKEDKHKSDASAPVPPSQSGEPTTQAVKTDPVPCTEQYQVINYQIGTGSQNWPEKICVFKSGESIRWYGLIAPPESSQS